MNRKEFIKLCAGGCLGAVFLQTTLSGCATQKQVNAMVIGENLEVPLVAFEKIKDGELTYLDSVIVRNPMLQYPVAVFRFSQDDYQALLMKCTHQGTELKLYGDTLQCIAHGSEFDNKGNATNGVAVAELRKFPVVIDNQKLRISLQ